MSSSTPAVPTTYRVPDSECPSNYSKGLSVTAESAAEVEYLHDIVACVNFTGTTTYLKNDSDAVWTLHHLGSTPGRVDSWNEDLVASSFRAVVGSQQALMVPRAVVTVNLPPEEVRWKIDLPLSVDWEGHELVAEKIKSVGQEALVAAVRRESPARAALVACTLGVDGVARGVPTLADADLTGVVLTGLGATANKCRQAAVLARVVDETGRVVTLSDDLGTSSGRRRRWNASRPGSATSPAASSSSSSASSSSGSREERSRRQPRANSSTRPNPAFARGDRVVQKS